MDGASYTSYRPEMANTTFEGTLWKEVRDGKLERLENADCIREYSAPFAYHRRNLILVMPEDNSTIEEGLHVGAYPVRLNNKVQGACGPMGYDWICHEAFLEKCNGGGGCSKQAQEINPANWTAFEGRKPKYCLSETVPQTCTLRFSSSLAWVVIAFNGLKLLLLIGCSLPKGPLDGEQPLLTVGDAISSFLRRNDETTRHLSAMGTSDLGRWAAAKVEEGTKEPRTKRRLSMIWVPWERDRVFRAVLLQRWRLLLIS